MATTSDRAPIELLARLDQRGLKVIVIRGENGSPLLRVIPPGRLSGDEREALRVCKEAFVELARLADPADPLSPCRCVICGALNPCGFRDNALRRYCRTCYHEAIYQLWHKAGRMARRGGSVLTEKPGDPVGGSGKGGGRR